MFIGGNRWQQLTNSFPVPGQQRPQINYLTGNPILLMDSLSLQLGPTFDESESSIVDGIHGIIIHYNMGM